MGVDDAFFGEDKNGATDEDDEESDNGGPGGFLATLEKADGDVKFNADFDDRDVAPVAGDDDSSCESKGEEYGLDANGLPAGPDPNGSRVGRDGDRVAGSEKARPCLLLPLSVFNIEVARILPQPRS